MIKVKITRPDGYIIEAEGTPAELNQLSAIPWAYWYWNWNGTTWQYNTGYYNPSYAVPVDSGVVPGAWGTIVQKP